MAEEAQTKVKPLQKKKRQGKNNKGRDAYERMNFLHQAAKLNLVINPENEELSRYYMKCFRSVKEKKCLKWSREMKRSICNGCNMLLTPGVTTKVRVGENKRINITCLSCNAKKRVHIANKKTPNGTYKKKKRRNKSKHKVNTMKNE